MLTFPQKEFLGFADVMSTYVGVVWGLVKDGLPRAVLLIHFPESSFDSSKTLGKTL